jgi:hypothetical protein
MVPHSLFVSSDRHVDLALNLLTMVVGGALLATVAYLMFAWIRPGVPAAERAMAGPPAWAAMPALLLPPPLEFELQLPGLPTIYRCEQRGRITYTDRPCAAGDGRALTERPS